MLHATMNPPNDDATQDPSNPRGFQWDNVSRIAARTRDTVLGVLTLAGHATRRVHALARTIDRDGRQVVADAAALWASIQIASRRAEATWQATPRIARLLREVARVAAIYQLHHLKVGFFAESRQVELTTALHHREGARIRAFCEEMGGGLLKVGQLLSARADLLPEAWVQELASLQDRVPPADLAEVMALLKAEVPDFDSLFSEFDEAPVAAASLAQVHRAHLADGRVVAVKIQRPGIDRVIAQDQRALAVVADIFGGVMSGFDAGPFLREVAVSLGEELDFRAEAVMGSRFRAAFGDSVAIPLVVGPTTERVLVMDFIEALRLPDFLASAVDSDRDTILADLARTIAAGMLVHGLVHGDPHPGNFLVIPANETSSPRLVMLDFGAALVLTETERRAYVELLPALFSRNEAIVAHLLTELGFTAPDPAAPAAFALAIASSLVPQDLASIDPRAELERGLALAKLYPGLVVPTHFVRISRALAAVSGVFMQYRPDLNLGALLMQVLVKASAPR